MEVLTVSGGPVATNAYLVADDHGSALLIDPGFELDELAAAVERRAWRVEAIALTHGHFDHVAGVAEAKRRWGAPLWIHSADRAIACRASEHAGWFGLESPDCPPPDHTYDHGDVLTVGELRFSVRHTPGHSPGGVCLLLPGHAFVGDTLFAGSIGRHDLPHSDPDALLRSIQEQLMVLPDDTIVYPGHGPATTIGDERRNNPFRRYFGAML